MPNLTYHTAFDTTRVPNFNRNKSYRIPLQTGTGHYKTALARFTDQSGWEYLHLDYDKWFTIPDEVEIFESSFYELIQDCVDESIKPNEVKGFPVLGVDPSGMGRDYTVGLVGVATSHYDQVLVVDEIYRVQKATMNQHLYGLSEIIKRRDIRLVGIEKNSFGQIWLEELAKKKNNPLTNVHGIHTTTNSKLLMLDRVAYLMASQRLWIPNHKPLINELLSYSIDNKGHDDCVMALCMLVSITQELHWGVPDGMPRVVVPTPHKPKTIDK